MRRLITTDSHLVPPVWLADELPAKWRDQFTHLEVRDGQRHIVYATAPGSEAQMGINSGGRGAVVKVKDDADLVRVTHANVCDEARPSYDPEERLAEMALEGVVGAVLIDNAVVSMPYLDPDAEVAWCRIVNDWMASTFAGYLDRFAPGMHLPLRDIGAAVKELERAAAMGLRPAVLPDALVSQPYYRPEWEPLWEAGAGLGVPFTMHIGGTRFDRGPDLQMSTVFAHEPPSLLAGSSALIRWYMMDVGMAETIGWFVFSGLFHKYPRLQIVMTEGFAGWLAFAMQFFDHEWEGRWGRHVKDKYHLGGLENFALDAPPSHYIKRQAHATFMWDPVAIRNRDLTGTDCLLWGNDYPHFEGSFPHSQSWVDKQFAGVPEDEIDAMVRGNAAALFGLAL
jgi:predicted TIM-barrel fold metal-dependent hydrolase